MSIPLQEAIPLGEIVKIMPGRPHLSTVYRWAHRKQAPLETIRIGGERYTSEEALSRYFQRKTAAADGESVAINTRSGQNKSAEYLESEGF